MIKYIIVILSAICLYSCMGNYELNNLTVIENHSKSSVFNLTQDSMLCYLNDYFPTMNGIDSIIPPMGIEIDITSEENKFIIKKNTDYVGVNVINIWKNGVCYALVTQECNNNPRENMFTLSPSSKKEIKIGFDKQPCNIIALWQNVELPSHFIKIKDGTATIRIPDNIKNNMALRSLKRSYIRIYAYTADVLYSDILVPLENGEILLTTNFITKKDHESKIIYSLMKDRFNNGNFENDRKLNSSKLLPQVDYYAGDIKGITSKVDENYFTDLGVNTIWVSPIINLLNPQNSYFKIGKTYGSNDLIGSYVKNGMQNGKFDFNVYFTAINSIGKEDGDMKELLNEIISSLNNYGYHNYMGYILGNHDQPRLISLADDTLPRDEDSKQTGWNRTISEGDSIGYNKLFMLHTLNFTIPGIPCIYHRDEYGELGGHDPDNWRMMRFNDLSKKENELLNKIKGLIKERSSSLALIYGQFIPLECNTNCMAYARTYMGDTYIIGFNNSDTTQKLDIKLPLMLSNNSIEINIPPYNTEIIKLNKYD